MVEDDAVNGIQQAAYAIYAQRTRLNNAFSALESALSILKPGMKLMGNGAIVDPSLPVGEQVVAYIPNAGTVPVPPTHVEDHPYAESDVLPSLDEDENHTENRAMVATFILANGVTRPSKIDERFLKEPYHWSIRQLNDYIQTLRTEKVIKRERDGRLVHRDYSPKVDVDAPRPEGGRGSGTRRDTMPSVRKVTEHDDRVHYKHAYPVGSAPGDRPSDTALCGFPRKEAVNDSKGRCPQCTELVRGNARRCVLLPERPTVTPPPPKADAASTPAVNADGTYGLAHSPKPRDAVRAPVRKYEETLDAVVLWAQDQNGILDALTAARDLSEKPTNMSKYFRVLNMRGVFEAHPDYVDKDYFPLWLIEQRGGKGGRGTRAYRLPKADAPSPQASGQTSQGPVAAETLVDKPNIVDLTKLVAPTLEQVRDAAIDLREPNMVSLINRLGKSNERMMRRAVREHMAALVQRGIFVDAGEEGVSGVSWRYVPPTDAGAAARYDRVHKPTNTETVATAATAQSGNITSGRRPNVGNKEVQAIVNAACRKWGENAVQFMAKHIRINLPDGSNVTIAHTPNQRGLLRDKSRLRKAGLALA